MYDEVMKVKALLLKQPYANWVASGRKTIETRSWATKYRGDLLVCSSQSGEGEPKGLALCLVELYDIRPMIAEDEVAACIEVYLNANAWLIRNRRPLASPFAVSGKLGIYELQVPE